MPFFLIMETGMQQYHHAAYFCLRSWYTSVAGWKLSLTTQSCSTLMWSIGL